MGEKKPAARQWGFSLVEVLVALAILGFIVLGIVGLFSRSVLENASGYDYARLSAVARHVIEDMQSRPFNDPVLAGGTRQWTGPLPQGFRVDYSIDDYRVFNWNEVQSTPWPAPAPTAVPTPGVPTPVPGPGTQANLKRVTLHVRTTKGTGIGMRDFVVTALIVP